MTENIKHSIILSVFSIGLCIPALIAHFPDSQDGVFALMAFQSFSSQLYTGELYPRWLYDFYSGFGAPMFYFYPPFLFYLESLFDTLTFRALPDYLILGITATCLHISSGLACYYWIRQIYGGRKALLGALLYILLPNHLIFDLYYKGTLTELSAYTWLPLLLLFLKQSSHENKAIVYSAICYALLIMSSVPMALAFTPFLLLYVGYNASEYRSFQALLKPISSLVLGFGLAGMHIITAYLMTEYIDTEKFWTGFYDPRNWFICMLNCNHSPYAYMAFKISNILWGQFVCIIAMFLLCLKYTKNVQDKNHMLFWFIIAAGAVFMMSETSIWFWDNLPLIERIQFPWRLALALELAFVIFTARLFPLNRQSLKLPELGLLCILISFVLLTVQTGLLFKERGTLYPAETFTEMVETRDYFGVYIPNLTDTEIRKTDLANNAMPFASANIGTISEIKRIPQGFSMKVSAHDKTTLKIRQFYFPSWAAYSSTDGNQYKLQPNQDIGYIEIEYPGGTNTIHLIQKTLWQEMAGWIISLISALILLSIFASTWRNKTLSHNRTPPPHNINA